MGRASGGSSTPHWIRNNILDFLRAMSMKIAVEKSNVQNTSITIEINNELIHESREKKLLGVVLD